MPIDLGAGLPMDFEGIPPHMSAVDYVLWNRFRRSHKPAGLRMYFDVAVGPGEAVSGSVDQALREAWKRLTQQRIDVVIERMESWVIVEVRGAAGPGAIGSLVTYRSLWLQDAPDSRPVFLWLVTDVISQNLRSVLLENGISLFLV